MQCFVRVVIIFAATHRHLHLQHMNVMQTRKADMENMYFKLERTFHFFS
jgi:hypothetical protein